MCSFNCPRSQAPQRVVGPSIEVELAAFLDALSEAWEIRRSKVGGLGVETASEATPNPRHCGRGGWTFFCHQVGGQNLVDDGQEAARAELEQSVADDDGKAGTLNAAVIDRLSQKQVFVEMML